MKSTLAIDIGGTNFSIALFEGKSLIGKLSHPTDQEAGPTGMLDEIEKMLRVLSRDAIIHGCGIGFGAPVDFAAQKVIASTHVDGWEAFDLVREIQNRFGTAVFIYRDSMAGALGEGYFGGRPRLPAAFLS